MKSHRGNIDDASLIARIVAADERALRELVALYGERVFRYALRLTQSEATAEEVASDVVFEVWGSAHRFRSEAKVSTWILGITRNLALNAIRGKKPIVLDPAVLGDTEDDSYDIEADVRRQERERAAVTIRAALRSMSVEHRDVLELTFFHGCSYGEIAEIAGCPVATVRTRMFYAKRLLRQALLEVDDDRVRDLMS